VELLDKIQAWGDKSLGPGLFWLSGAAGSGKSTIARTVARYFADRGRLGASFFFSRGRGDLGGTEKLFTTLAAQLANALPSLKQHIYDAVTKDHNIGTSGMSEQWKKLIYQPASKLGVYSQCRPTIIVVIDALDECDHEGGRNDMGVILRLLQGVKDLSTIWLRIFITSRPEISLNEGFEALQWRTFIGIPVDSILHHISKDKVQQDLLVFIRNEFERIREERLLSDWVKEEDISSLARDANGLFVYAATVCRFIDRRHPDKHLLAILPGMRSSSPGHRISPTRSPDEMYTQVLKSSITSNYKEEDSKDVLELYKHTLGSLAVLLETLPLFALTNLLDLQKRDVDEILHKLQAVLDVPDAHDSPICILHTSFRDFVLNKNRCRDLNFWIDEMDSHRRLFRHCIRLMSIYLRRDICRQQAPGTLVADVDNDCIKRFLPAEVRYACLYWIHHLQKSGTQLVDNDEVHQFLQDHFLHWLEALGWLRRTTEEIRAISALEAHILVSYPSMLTRRQSLIPIKADKSPELHAFVHDAKRFFIENGFSIAQAPLQVYCSALVFAPEKSVIRKRFEACIPAWIEKKPNVQEHWCRPLQTFGGPSTPVESVAFSPNSKLIVSPHGNEARIWDAITGAVVHAFGYDHQPTSVAFSPDGKQVVSTISGSKKVSFTDAASGAVLYLLDGHSDTVQSVDFSPDGKMVISRSIDRTVRLWSAGTGALLWTLDCYESDKPYRSVTDIDEMAQRSSGWIRHIAISPDGKLVVAGSFDRTRLWDITTKSVRVLEGYSGKSRTVAFSPDSKLVLSGSDEKIIRLWDTAAGGLRHTLEGHLGRVSSACFSPDGKIIVSGSFDKTVRLWNAETGTMRQILEGHPNAITVVAFSPDGKLIASLDKRTLCLWDAKAGAVRQSIERLSSQFTSLAFSPDSRLLVSATSDGTVQVWDALAETTQPIVEAPKFSWIMTVLFSPDGKLVGSVSQYNEVRLWDVNTGVARKELQGHGHLGMITSVGFSKDSKFIAVQLLGGKVHTWDVLTGTSPQAPEEHLRDPPANVVHRQADDVFFKAWPGDADMKLRDAATKDYSPQSLSNGWLKEGEKNILWLPPEYRVTCGETRNGLIVLGHADGRVSFLKFTEGPKLI
jgi:WD40 repeat protein